MGILPMNGPVYVGVPVASLKRAGPAATAVFTNVPVQRAAESPAPEIQPDCGYAMSVLRFAEWLIREEQAAVALRDAAYTALIVAPTKAEAKYLHVIRRLHVPDWNFRNSLRKSNVHRIAASIRGAPIIPGGRQHAIARSYTFRATPFSPCGVHRFVMSGIGSALGALVLLTVFDAISPAQIGDFLEAARADDVPKLQTLLARAPLIHTRGPHARTALHEAAAHCRLQAARFLIEHGAEIQAVDDSSATPADLAAQCPPDVRADFQVLLPRPQLDGQLSMQSAIAHRRTQVVSMLLTLGFNVNAMAADGDRPLNTAAAAGDAAITNLLLEHGADPNLPSQSGSTPLHDAALRGDAESITLLLSHGARIDTRTPDDGSTALHLAASFDRLDAVKALVRHGADTTLKNAKGFTAAELASRDKFADVSAYLASVATAH